MRLTDFQKELVSGLGGHDVAAILGYHPFKTRFDVFLEKVNGEFNQSVSKAMERGTYLEPALVSFACDKLALQARPCPMVRHKQFPHLIGHPDRLLYDEKKGSDPVAVLEAKTSRFKGDWGEEGTDKVPPFVIIQVQHYMMLTGLSEAWVAGDVAYELKMFPVSRADAIMEAIIDEGNRFWVDHVKAQKPPEVDGSDAAGKMLKTLFQEDTGEIIEADAELEALFEEYQSAREAAAVAATVEAEYKQKFQQVMKDASMIQGNGWKITWKAHEQKRTDWKGICKHLEVADVLIDEYSTASTVRKFLPPRLEKK